MRHTRWAALAGLVLVGGALAGWALFAMLSHPSDWLADGLHQNGTQAELVDTKTGPDLCGVVKSVDASHETITLGVALEDGKEQNQTYGVTKGAKVVLEGPATLGELAAGTRVGLEFDASRKVVAIRSEPFLVTAKPKQQEVEVGKPFDIELRVVNVSPTPQSFWVTSCSWDMHWESSNPYITAASWPCKMNVPMSVTLAPREAYEKTLAVRATATGLVLFKMGFVPLERENSFSLGKRIYWSPEVMIKARDGP